MPVTVTTTWHYPKRVGFVSAWDSAATFYEKETGNSFTSLTRSEQIAFVRQYINREVASC